MGCGIQVYRDRFEQGWWWLKLGFRQWAGNWPFRWFQSMQVGMRRMGAFGCSRQEGNKGSTFWTERTWDTAPAPAPAPAPALTSQCLNIICLPTSSHLVVLPNIDTYEPKYFVELNATPSCSAYASHQLLRQTGFAGRYPYFTSQSYFYFFAKGYCNPQN